MYIDTFSILYAYHINVSKLKRKMFCVHFIDHEIDQRHVQTDRTGQDRRGQT